MNANRKIGIVVMTLVLILFTVLLFNLVFDFLGDDF